MDMRRLSLVVTVAALLTLSMAVPASAGARWGVSWVGVRVSSEDQGPAKEVTANTAGPTDRLVFTFTAPTRCWGHHKLVFHGSGGTRRLSAGYFLVTPDGRVPITREMKSEKGFVLGRGTFPEVTIVLVVNVTVPGARRGVLHEHRFTVTAGDLVVGKSVSAVGIARTVSG